jgi:hypothetical protein
MNDDAESTVVLDSSGNGYHGTSVRNTNLMHVVGKVNGALKFNKTDDYINCGQSFEDILQTGFSIVFDYKPLENPSFFRDICGTARSLSESEIRVMHTKWGRLAISFYTTSGQDEITAYDFIDDLDVWYHVVITVGGNGAVLYKNSVVFEQNTGLKLSTGYTNTNPFIIGGFWGIDQIATASLLNGVLDNFMIFNKALDETEVSYLYNDGKGRESLVDISSAFNLEQEYWSW